MTRFPITAFSMLALSGCTALPEIVTQPQPTPAPLTAVGFGALASYPTYPPSQQRMLAIRAAKVDAYRSLVEELHGAYIRGSTSMNNGGIAQDSYRAYVDGLVRGAHLTSITPKPDGVYAVELELRLTLAVWDCLRSPTLTCLNIPVNTYPTSPPCAIPACGTPVYSQLNSPCMGGCSTVIYPEVRSSVEYP